ncbi:acyltransferase family protein [Roseburia intestinalis]|uniref:acyltransferase family protein n=1 Tax=Roseburia intestinalis TaxID=166486 RepID=UPI003521A90F
MFNFISLVHMPILFFVSGFFIGSSIQKDGYYNLIYKKVKSLLVPFILWSAVAFCSNIVIDILSQRISIGDIIRTQFIDIFVYARLVWFLLILFIVDIIYIIVYAAGIVWLVYFVSKYFLRKIPIYSKYFLEKR